MAEDASGRFNWAGLPLIATDARLLCRELTVQNEYLRLENKVLKSKIKGRIRSTDQERRSLAAAALAMGRKLMRQVVSIVKPDTILAWLRPGQARSWSLWSEAGSVRGSGNKVETSGRAGRPLHGDVSLML